MRTPEELRTIKKTLAKVVKGYRDSLPKVHHVYWNGEERLESPAYPKLMMTNQQMDKGTCTINFGVQSERVDRLMDEFEICRPFLEAVLDLGLRVGNREYNPQDGHISKRLYY